MTTNYREFDSFIRDTSNDGSGTILLQNISNDIQLFNRNVSVLERRIKLLNTPQDGSELRQEIIEMVSDTVQLARMARSSIDKTKDQARSFAPAEKVQFERLVSTFKTSVSKFQRVQQSTSELEQEMLRKARSDSMKKHKHSPDFLPESEREMSNVSEYEVADQDFRALRQRQAQMQDDTATVELREREMRQLETDILDINDIFRDLGTMVHEQGDMIDNIESNVETAAVSVESGNKQLEKALRHKKCNRKMTCITCCIVITILLAIIIVATILICTVGVSCKSN